MASFRMAKGCCGVATAALILAGGSVVTRPALALDDDGKANVFTGLLTLIDIDPFKRTDKGIDYRERAPLVLPPKMDLPPPGAPQAHGPDWPQDPDILRRKKEAEQSLIPSIITRQGEADNRMRRDQLAGSGGTPAPTDPPGATPTEHLRGCGHGKCNWVPPDELQSEGAAASKMFENGGDHVVAGQEPPRKYLTDPPKGYRMPTATVKATNDGPAIKAHDDNAIQFWKDLNPFKSSDDED